MSRSETQRLLMYEMAAFSRKLRAHFDSVVREKGLTLPRARVLFALADREGATQSELAGLLDIETPTLVRLLDSMAETGLIERRAAEGDRRVRRIFMTGEGRIAALEVHAIADDFRNVLMKDMELVELEMALAVTQKLLANLLTMKGGSDPGA